MSPTKRIAGLFCFTTHNPRHTCRRRFGYTNKSSIVTCFCTIPLCFLYATPYVVTIVRCTVCLAVSVSFSDSIRICNLSASSFSMVYGVLANFISQRLTTLSALEGWLHASYFQCFQNLCNVLPANFLESHSTPRLHDICGHMVSHKCCII